MALAPVNSEERLDKTTVIRIGSEKHGGWAPTLRKRFGHYTPDDYYESYVDSLVGDRTEWIDVGGGREIFPDNPKLARILANRCKRLVAVDPSSNVNENSFAQERVQALLEDYEDSRGFSLATMRMVVEHVVRPQEFVVKLSQLVRINGNAVVYTVNRWAPISLVSAITPMCFHQAAKKALWNTKEDDTFPVIYRMNTRSRLRSLFTAHGFREVSFCNLDDCRTLARWRLTLTAELVLWKALRSIRLRYPETCLLGVYKRV